VKKIKKLLKNGFIIFIGEDMDFILMSSKKAKLKNILKVIQELMLIIHLLQLIGQDIILLSLISLKNYNEKALTK